MKLFNAMFSKVNGGLEQVFLNYTPVLELQGNEVISVIHPQAEIKDSCPKDHLVMVHNFNQYDYFAIRRLRKLIKSENPDCIITHSYRAAYLFNKTGTCVPKISVCHVNGNYEFGSDAIIALTEHMRQDIIRSGKPAHTVFTVPNMIHIPDEQVYKVPEVTNVPVIGVCARFAAIKGIDIFIDALAELKRRKIPFAAKIAGDGEEKERYVRLIKQHDLQNDITLLGWITDKSHFYESIDIFCLPSREETFGLVILENMMHSVPMVLSAVSGPLEIIGNSNSAIMVPPCDSVGMADGLERIIRDSNLAKELASNAFNRVKYYSNQNIAPILHGVVEQVCLDYDKASNR